MGSFRKPVSRPLIHADSPAGGLVGGNVASGEIESSSAAGDVTASFEVGGLIGNNRSGDIELSFATGEVDDGSAVGGVVEGNGATVTDMYWDEEATGQQDGIGDGQGDTTGLDTNEMQGEAAAENMETLDFEAIWTVQTDPDDYPALIALEETPQPPPIGGGGPPQDLNGDGLHEDVRGDDEFTILDVQALFDNLDSDAVQNNAAAFDFSGLDPDEVTIFDVQALFNRLQD